MKRGTFHSLMTKHAHYLPPPVRAGDPFAGLYREYFDVSFYEVTTIKRISPTWSLEQVYRRLPSAADFEYAGYLTKTQIAYCEGWETTAPILASRPCMFHSHPTDYPYADMPSPSDVYWFLKQPSRRKITVGRELIWWWDKEPAFAKTVRRFNAWEAENLLAECQRLGRKKGWMSLYFEKALAALGCRLTRSKRCLLHWTEHLWQTLRLRTYFIETGAKK